MLAAIFTTLLWSGAAIMSQRSVRELGSIRANLGRLIIAFVLLGVYAHTWGLGLGGAGRDAFLWSGVIGMGLGDLALFAALPRLGARLTVLICQCVAVPIAMVTEWAWLDAQLPIGQIFWAGIIVAGVAFALMPSKRSPPRVPVTKLGILLGLGAAVGQGLGAVISRRAYEITTDAGMTIDGITAAYQRITGGLVITLSYFIIVWLRERRPTAPVGSSNHNGYFSRGNGYMFGNAMLGPVLGVSCYQWALATTPSGIVLPIVATTPLIIIPLTYWFEGDRPSRRSLIGGVVAVAGVVALTLVR
jgi:drug/metabolite transporter (DMT)-like permease